MFDGVALDRKTPPTNEELLAIVARHSPLSFEEIKRQTSGKIFDLPPMVVQPEPEGATGRFEVIPEDVRQELAEVRQEVMAAGEFPFRLAVRRMREAQNSSFRNAPTIHHIVPYNAAHIHPEDLAALRIGSGDTVQIASAHGSIDAIAEADDSLRRGIVSMSHGWGDGGLGVNVNRLTSSDRYEPINGMPVMAGVPVKVEPRASVARAPVFPTRV